MGRLIVRSVCTLSAIPLFDRRRHHSSVPTEAVAAAARSGRPGRPNGRREAASPWTVASTVACSPSVGIAACSAVTSVLIAILMVACAANELNRILSKLFAFLAVRDWEQGQTDRGRRDKSADCRRALVIAAERRFAASHEIACRRFCQSVRKNNRSGAVAYARHLEAAVNPRDNDLHIRPGRIRDGGRGAVRPKSFVGQVMRAARKAGHTGKGFGRQGGNTGSRFGRGRSAALALSLRSPSRRVVIKARVVRHRGHRFRSAHAHQACHLP